ncbi:DUF11 domain-containing protein [Streptomyces sp. GbtcB6]|uniref:DUF11 domain-containing protein n=1 Tax=Streptomyces sp. GbtcB6 TaxID=2824751 RepID=UPI001C308384|nr:DUF11 domain-containing protein [Streptomyces sp. GbtcB6]
MSRLSRPFRHGSIARPAVLLVLAFLVASLAVLNRGGPAIASSPAAQGRIAYGGTQIRSIGVIGPADTTTSTPLFPDGPQHYDDEPSARGDAVVWTSLRASAQPQVFIRQGDGAPVQITKGLTGVQYPVLSPDRHRIAFAASTGRTDGGHDLWVVNADGTGLRRVTDGTGDNTWPTWDPSGTVIGFSATRAGDLCSEIYTVDASGGTIRQLTHESSLRCGTALGDFEPDWDPVAAHQRLLYTSVSPLDGGDTRRQIIVLQVQTGGERLLSSIAESKAGSWSPDGTSAAFLSDAPPDGPPTRTMDRVYTVPVPVAGESQDPQLRLSEDRQVGRPTWFLPAHGAQELLVPRDTAATAGTMDLSDMRPDGSDPRDLQLALRDVGRDRSADCQDGQRYSPDGRRIAFTRMDRVEEGDAEVLKCRVWVAEADGTDPRPLVAAATPDENDTLPAWSPDGTRIALAHRAPDSDQPGSSVNVVDATDGRTLYTVPRPLQAQDSAPVFSPDGRTLAFARTEPTADGNRTHIWTVRAADGTGAQDLSAVEDPGQNRDGDNLPAYSPDGRRLVFRSGDGSRIGLMDADGHHVRTPTSCLPGADTPLCGAPSWSPDGSRIIVSADASRFDTPSPHLVIVDPASGAVTPVSGPSVHTLDAGSGQEAEPTWQPTADLATSAPAPAPSASPGQAATLVIAVTNQGPAVDSRVELTLAVPAGLRLTALDAPGGSCRAAEFRCTLGSLTVGRTVLVTARLTGDTAGVHAISWSTDGWVLDPDLSDNHAGANVSAGGHPATAPALRITAAPAPAYVGGPVTLTYTVTNPAAQPATGVTLRPVIPKGLQATHWPFGCDPADGCSLGDLSPGASVAVQLIVTPTSAGTFHLAGSVTAAAMPDPAPKSSRARQTLRVLQPAVIAAPAVGPPGFVTSVRGRDFPPGVPVKLVWKPGLTAASAPVVPARNGSFTAQLLIMPGDETGARTITASGTGYTPVSTAFLVSQPVWGPPLFGDAPSRNGADR